MHLDCQELHALNSPEAEWLAACAKQLSLQLEAFLEPADRLPEHEHRWALSEANDGFAAFECLDCRGMSLERQEGPG